MGVGELGLDAGLGGKALGHPGALVERHLEGPWRLEDRMPSQQDLGEGTPAQTASDLVFA